MSEIKDKTISEISDLIRFKYGKLASWEIAKLIIGLHNVAIVDRDAELPQYPQIVISDDLPPLEFKQRRKAQQDMIEAGYVKEIK